MKIDFGKLQLPVRKPGSPKAGSKSNKNGPFSNATSCIFSVEIETGQRSFYRVDFGNNKVERIDEGSIDPESTVLTAYRDDWRLETDRAISNKSATSLLARELELFDQLTVVNKSRDRNTVYATKKSRILEVPWDQTPITAVLDRMIEKDAQRPTVVGVAFGDLDVIVLFYYPENGLITEKEMQVSLQTRSSESAINSFAAKHHTPDAPTKIFEIEEFASALRNTPALAYPKHLTILGLSYQQALIYSTAAAWTVALAVGGWGGLEYAGKVSIENEIDTLHIETDQKVKQTGEELVTKVESLAEFTSIQFDEGLKTADLLRPPGGKVRAKLLPTSFSYTVHVPMKRKRDKSALQIQSLNRAFKALNTQPPEGCSHTGTNIAGGLDEIKTGYLCPRSSGGANYNW